MVKKNTQIKISNLHKSYRDGEGRILHILKGVGLEVTEGATVAIVGASGTGKSTFLHLIGGLDQADEGVIEIERQVLSSLNRNELAQFRNEKVAFIFQFHHLLQDFTALENVMMPLRINRQAVKLAKTKGEMLLEKVGLKDRLHHKASQLSGGEQQRVAIARALANSPKILLADEPTGNLDQETGQQIFELLFNLNQEYGITLIVITHNPSLANLMQDQYRMADGLLHPVSASPNQ